MDAQNGGLEIETTFNPLQWLFYFFQPVIVVNGHSFKVPWGKQLAPMPPGQHHVKIYVPYFFGPACVGETWVNVYPGHVTGLRYETPFWTFSPATLRDLGTRPL